MNASASPDDSTLGPQDCGLKMVVVLVVRVRTLPACKASAYPGR